MASYLVEVDFSNNPLHQLPERFGDSALWMTGATGTGGGANSLPTLSLRNCSLTGLPLLSSSFGRTWETLDLSQNDFSNGALVNWTASLGQDAFLFTQTLNLSSCKMTSLPQGAIHGSSSADPPTSNNVPTASSVIDLSYNAFSAWGSTSAPTVGLLRSFAFAGTIDLSHSGLRVLYKDMMAASSIGNLDFSYNNLESIDLTSVKLSDRLDGQGTFNLSNNDLGVLASANMTGFSASVFDLSGNALSFERGNVFEKVGISDELILERCGLTSASLANDPFALMQSGLKVLSLGNNAADAYLGPSLRRSNFNSFVNLSGSFLVGQGAPLASLTSLTLGEVQGVEQGFWGSFIISASEGLAVTIQLPEGATPLEEGGALWNMMTGYENVAPDERLNYALTVAGSAFSAATPSITPVSDTSHSELDRMYPSSLSVPLDPSFMYKEFWAHFPDMAILEFVPPSSVFQAVDGGATPWSGQLDDSSVPVDLLEAASGMTHFKIALGNAYPASPVTTLPADIFQPLIPAGGFGALVSVDLSTAQLQQYPSDLFAGLSRSGTQLLVDMNVLYAGMSPIPLGLFDDLPVTGSLGPGNTVLAGEPRRNWLRHCAYLVNQVCETCPPGSYATNVNGYYYCARCAAGSFCINGVTAPCPRGQYQMERQQSACITCDPGTYNPSLGQAQPYACLSCSAGKYQPDHGAVSSSACTDCPAGSYSALASAASCSACGAGTYASEEGTSCKSCPLGRFVRLDDAMYLNGTLLSDAAFEALNRSEQALVEFVERGASDLDECNWCPLGQTTSSAGATSSDQCVDTSCPAGMYFVPNQYDDSSYTEEELEEEHAKDYKDEYCRDCPAGSSCTNNKKTICAPGTWNDGVWQLCQECPKGTHLARSGGTSEDECVPCPAGSFNEQWGAASCTSCPEGSLGTEEGAVSNASCLVCAARTDLDQEQLCFRGSSSEVVLDVLLPNAPSFIFNTSRASYAPVRGGPSLRLLAAPSDPTLLLAAAFNVSEGASSLSHSSFDPTGALVLSSTMEILMICLLVGSAIPLLLYRFIPKRVVPPLDVFSQAHKLMPGGLKVNSPTQYGAAFSLCFVLVALFVALQLGTQSNATMTSTLQPASANNNTGSARGAWQISVRAFGAPSADGSALSNALDQWCVDGLGAPLSTTGFDGTPSLRYSIQSGACVLLIDCLDCGMGGVGSFSITVPAAAQLLEWEVWSTGAVPGSWSRFYGVASPSAGELLDAASTLRFSAMEAYFLDTRDAESITYCTDPDSHFTGVTCSLPTASSGSGFELSFSDWETEQVQEPSLLTASSTVTLRFLFNKQDVVYQTSVSSKQSVFQILSSVLATVVSLLSVFAVVFALSERHVLRRLKLPSGLVDTKVHIMSDEQRALEAKHQAQQQMDAKQRGAGTTSPLASAKPVAPLSHTSTVAGEGLPSPRKVTVELVSPSGAAASTGAAAAQGGGESDGMVAAHGDVHELLSSHNNAASPSGGGLYAAAFASDDLSREVRELRAERQQTNAAIAALQAQLLQLQQRIGSASARGARSPPPAATAFGEHSPEIQL